MITVYTNRWGIKIPAFYDYFLLLIPQTLHIQKIALLSQLQLPFRLMFFHPFITSIATMCLLFTDASSIIKSIKEIHAQHVDLMPDNPHIRDIQGGYSHGETIYERK